MENPITGWFNGNVLGSYTEGTGATILIWRIADQMFEKLLAHTPPVTQAYVVAASILIGFDCLYAAATDRAASLALCLINARGGAITAIGSNAILVLPMEKPSEPKQ